MKKGKLFCLVAFMLLSFNARSFDVVTEAKVVYIDEFDIGYTKIGLDSPTSCGATWIWMSRTMTGYDQYLARALTALVANRQIRIVERAPAYCSGTLLYNPRIGIQ